ncbi:MAG: MATE family efflux transporter [Polyangiaceae bacterium]|nr:MATE family efflux transporter [Polyangiaceae bacterium]
MTPSEQNQSGAVGRLARFVRLALSTHDHDFTRGSLRKAVLLLALPMVLEPLMEALFTVADALFVGRLGADALAVLGLTEGVVTLVYTVGFGLGIPVTAMIARRIGEHDHEGAARVAVQANIVALLVGSLLGVVGALYGREALALMGASPEVIALGGPYAAITLGSTPVIVLLFVNAAIFRGAGDAVVALRALWLANGINLLLDPCLIFGLGPFPEWGVTGAAAATVVGRGVGAVYLIWCLLRGTSRLSFSRRHLRVEVPLMRELGRLSVGGIGQLLVETSSWVILARIVALSGSVAIAGYTVALRVLVFALMPAWGLAGAAATLVGQNLGAQQPERATRALWLTGIVNSAFLGAVTIVCLTLAGPITAAFTPDAEVQAVAAFGVRVVALGYVFYAWGMVLTQAFNGAGDTRTPFILNLVCFWAFKLPLAYFLSKSVGVTSGPAGVFWAICVAYSLNATLAFVWFRSGRWKRGFERGMMTSKPEA